MKAVMNKIVRIEEKSPGRKIQKFRLWSQLFALAINIWIGIEFYLFVKYIESGGEALAITRPPGVEGWLPIGSLVSLRYWIESGVINDIHPSGMFIFIAILLTALLFKKGFCSWICPVGFISEMLGDISDKIFRRKIKAPRWLDYPLRSIKYLLLGFFIYAVLIQMTAQSIKAFIYTDYNIVTDFLMLKFFTDITPFALWVIFALFMLSLVIRGFWCRFLCPYGALLGLFNFISPTRIVRNQNSCTDCSSCANACPSFIKVDKVKEVISDECTGCMACVDSCPVNKTLELTVVTKRNKFSKMKWAAILVLFFWGSLLTVKMFGPWQNSITDAEYMRHVPSVNSGQYQHP
ncbi:4Fe-4S binding protein [Candidatus Zixiibacteriota bacterium]